MEVYRHHFLFIKKIVLNSFCNFLWYKLIDDQYKFIKWFYGRATVSQQRLGQSDLVLI